jgi:hypothetical protein
MGSVSVEWIALGRETVTFREFEGIVACRWNGVGVTAIRQIVFFLSIFSPLEGRDPEWIHAMGD